MDNPPAAGRATPAGAWCAAAAILLYVALLMGVRLGLSPFLEIDEAQFVGAVDLRLVYANSHPPLYNWLVRGALELSGGHWAIAVTAVKGVLLAATYLLVFDAARRLGGLTTGLLAVALMAFMPQISWMSAHTLAHSVLVMAAAAGVVNGVVRLATGPRWSAFVIIGLATAVGALAKANIFILVIPMALAMLTDRFWTQRLASLWAMAVPLIVGVLAGPAVWAMSQALQSSTERIEKLYRVGPFAPFDVPVLGLDGLISLAVAFIASAGIVAALTLCYGHRTPALDDASGSVRRLLWRTLALALGLSAAAIFATDISSVHERYLTPVLMPLPVVAALHLAPWRPWRIIGVAAAVFLAVPIGMSAMKAFDNHRFARPYDALAAVILPHVPGDRVSIAAGRESLAANMAIAFQRAGRQAWLEKDRHAPMTPHGLDLEPGEGDPVPPRPGFCALESLTVTAPMQNQMGRPMTVRATVSERC